MLFDDIAKANIQALKDHDKQARAILSVVYGKLKLESIEKGTKTLEDGECLRIISKTMKELEEEQAGYIKANRPEQVEEIEKQKQTLKKFLPQMLSENEIRAEIDKLEDKTIPNVMKHFKTHFNGLCDMGLVSKIAKEYH
ncbi:MAG: GatB/YqeY domain-containing protein [Anaeroplasmataceae bacterium]|nr:GatB/YqeY domain-containing protein [Anaeroplasmataceae bacterium]MDE5868525.1 GatB/YqeY domain-containing protein [Anaeroplasmataceae bacterium]